MNPAAPDLFDLIIADLVRLRPQVVAHVAKAQPDEAMLALLDWSPDVAIQPLLREALAFADHPGVLRPEAREAYIVARDLLDHNARERRMGWPEDKISRVVVAQGRGYVVAIHWALHPDEPPAIVVDASSFPLVATHHRGLSPELN